MQKNIVLAYKQLTYPLRKVTLRYTPDPRISWARYFSKEATLVPKTWSFDTLIPDSRMVVERSKRRNVLG